MAVTISDVYDALSEKMGKKEAKVVADYLEGNSFRIEDQIDKDIDRKIDHLAKKDDLSEVKLSIQNDITNLKDNLSEVKLSLKENANRLDVKIEATKSDIIKWMVSLVIALMIMILGLYATIIFK